MAVKQYVVDVNRITLLHHVELHWEVVDVMTVRHRPRPVLSPTDSLMKLSGTSSPPRPRRRLPRPPLVDTDASTAGCDGRLQ